MNLTFEATHPKVVFSGNKIDEARNIFGDVAHQVQWGSNLQSAKGETKGRQNERNAACEWVVSSEGKWRDHVQQWVVPEMDE